MVVDNRYQPRIAIKNAQLLIREGVDLVVEFQTDESVAPAIASAYHQARIPIIAIDIPHPGATYFGANNYEAGLLAGRQLARWAKQHWGGHADELLLLELARAGSVPAARMRGVAAGVRDVLHDAADLADRLDRRRRPVQDRARTRAQAPARDLGDADPGRRGQRSERARRGARVPGSRPHATAARSSARTPSPTPAPSCAPSNSPLIASVGYFPERYGEGVIRLALDLLGRRAVPPAMFVKHQLVTRDNVDHLYPNDALMGVERYARF